ncbi:helix-turn-helix domain-containing protein [Lachnospiraceae bacterium MD335]|nr:helix-turn-helix domain-containing protein [Lachnospiraceae bacterium MD335]
MIKTKKGNTNAMRKDIDPVKVYRLVEGGMSITKVAEKFHASRATIRKYYAMEEDERLYYEENL